MSRYTLTRMDAPTAALSEACGGQPYFWNRGTDARIIRAKSHESSVLVTAQVTRTADAADALRAALVDVAPAIAKRHRVEATEKRDEAHALLAEADALEDDARKIDAALAAMG